MDLKHLANVSRDGSGDNGSKEYKWRTNRPGKSKSPTVAERQLSDGLKDHFRVYFPTFDTVAESIGGVKVSISPLFLVST